MSLPCLCWEVNTPGYFHQFLYWVSLAAATEFDGGSVTSNGWVSLSETLHAAFQCCQRALILYSFTSRPPPFTSFSRMMKSSRDIWLCWEAIYWQPNERLLLCRQESRYSRSALHFSKRAALRMAFPAGCSPRILSCSEWPKLTCLNILKSPSVLTWETNCLWSNANSMTRQTCLILQHNLAGRLPQCSLVGSKSRHGKLS